MRVIAGTAGGIHLIVPKRGVRPTMDRVKAAMFSSLGEVVIGARVLDLFAGSGALGLEALSRGAASVIFVDKDSQSIAVIEKNLARANLVGRIHRQDVFVFLRRSVGKETFDLIFADPPYEKTESGERYIEKLLANQALPQLLESDGLFVLDKQPGESIGRTNFWRIVRA